VRRFIELCRLLELAWGGIEWRVRALGEIRCTAPIAGGPTGGAHRTPR